MAVLDSNARRLHLLFERGADGLKLDPDGRLLLVEASDIAALGFGPAHWSVGRDLIAFWQNGADHEAARTAVAGGVGERRGCLATAQDTPRWWHTTLAPVPDETGRITHVLAASQDVSDHERLARDLEAAATRIATIVQATCEIVWQSGAGQEDVVVVEQTSTPGQVASRRIGRAAWLSQIHPEDRTRVEAASRRGMDAGAGYVVEYRVPRREHAFRWIEDRVVALRDHDGRVVGWVGVATDIHERVLADQRLRDSEERLRLALAASQVGIWDVDLASGGRRWSHDLKAILGLPAEAVESEQLLLSLILPEDRPAFEAAHRSSSPTVITFRVRRADTGQLRWILSSGRAMLDEAGRSVRCLGTFQDITERKLIEDQLRWAANRDALTGLPNRMLFNTKLEEAIGVAKAEGTRVGLLIVDLDYFKEVNDTLGHDAGDAVLRRVAERLEGVCPAPATVARLGGDEFAVLIPDQTSEQIAAAAADLVTQLTRPMPYGDAVLTCSGSIGLAVFPDHDGDSGELLKNADLALYAAKGSGRSCHVVFNAAMKATLQKRVAVLRQTRDVLTRFDLVPYYQPKVGARGATVGGFEALLRWRNDGVVRGPGDLEEAFTDPELAAQIGERMLDLVVGDLVAWRAAGIAVGSVAINVAAAEFGRVDVAQRWLSALAHARLPASALQMEVTESVFLGNASDAIGRTLRRVHGSGIQVALDDFGTGFASLTHLRRYPVDWLKIDQSFIHDLADDSGARAIISGVIDLAHGIGLRVVAEGVETAAQSAILASKGCELLQGYLVAKPMAASRVADFVATWTGQGSRPPLRRLAARPARSARTTARPSPPELRPPR